MNLTNLRKTSVRLEIPAIKIRSESKQESMEDRSQQRSARVEPDAASQLVSSVATGQPDDNALLSQFADSLVEEIFGEAVELYQARVLAAGEC